MKIALNITVEVDPAAWAEEYGIEPKAAAVRADVQEYVRNALACSPVPLLAVARPTSPPTPAATEPPSAEPDLVGGAVYRTARKPWDCECPGGGQPCPHMECRGAIEPGERHVEYRAEAGPFESGARYCLPCGVATWSGSLWAEPTELGPALGVSTAEVEAAAGPMAEALRAGAISIHGGPEPAPEPVAPTLTLRPAIPAAPVRFRSHRAPGRPGRIVPALLAAAVAAVLTITAGTATADRDPGPGPRPLPAPATATRRPGGRAGTRPAYPRPPDNRPGSRPYFVEPRMRHIDGADPHTRWRAEAAARPGTAV